MRIFLLLMVTSSSINSDRGLPLMITLSPLISTVILVSFSPFFRMTISWVSFLSFNSFFSFCSFLSFSSFLSFYSGFSSCANAVIQNVEKPKIAAVNNTFFMTLYFIYEMFSRSNVGKIFELRNYSQIFFFALTIILGVAH